MQNSIAGMFDIESCNRLVQVADGDPLEVKMEGKWQEEILQGEDQGDIGSSEVYSPTQRQPVQ